MEEKASSDRMFMFLMVIFSFVFFWIEAALNSTHIKELQTLKAEAVKKGYAEFRVIDDAGSTEWRWKGEK